MVLDGVEVRLPKRSSTQQDKQKGRKIKCIGDQTDKYYIAIGGVVSLILGDTEKRGGSNTIGENQGRHKI